MIAIDFKNTHLHISEPERILVAEQLEEVTPLIKEVESFWKCGYYAVGFVSYEASPAFDPNLNVHPDNKLPLAWFAIFRSPDKAFDEAQRNYSVSEWQPDCSQENYQTAIEAIHQAIEKGDTYQVNHTIRLQSDFQGDPWTYYQHLTRLQRGYSAFLDTGRFQLLSVSPELFFHWENHQLITRPMKGTAKRGRNQQEDLIRAANLLDSTKDRAENLMIVDLLRNDLGKIAVPGSVHVPSLFTLEKYPTVWQMTSTIQATTPDQTSLSDIFTALFPCGSITGAPKRKTMEIIRELEPSPREAYCGTIGYLKPDGEAVFNVAIRTLVIDQETGTATYGVGGGITWDSTSKAEYEEVITKAKILDSKPYTHQLLESIRLENGTYTLLDKHMARIKESSVYFDYPFPEDEIVQQLKALAIRYQSGFYKVRLLVSSQGKIEVHAEELQDIVQPVVTALAKGPISSDNIFFYHKTTERYMYEEQKVAGFLDTLLWNEKGELTEFTIGNVVLELEGKLITPPVHSGLLAGVMRADLLETDKVQECIVYKEDIYRASSIWLVNSVRGWIKVQLVSASM